MHSTPTTFTRQVPLHAEGSSTSHALDDIGMPSIASNGVSVQPRGEKTLFNSVRRKPSPLWPQHEWSPEGITEICLEAPAHNARLSSASTTDSDPSMFLTTPRTPAAECQFSTDLSPKLAQSPHHFLPVDQPLFSEEKHVVPVASVIRSRPAISARTSSVHTEAHHSESRDSSLTGNKDQQKTHYLRAARPSTTFLSPEPSNSPMLETKVDRDVGSTRYSDFPTGLGIQGAFEQALPGQTRERAESKILPPIPLSRSTTGVAGGPAPLPTPRSTDTGWRTYKPKKVKQDFSVDKLVDPIKIWEASHCYVTDEFGRQRRFGEFFDTSSESQPPSGRRPLNGSSSRSNLSRCSSMAESLGSSSRKVCGGEEWNVPGRKTVVFYIRHFWCGQCEFCHFRSFDLKICSQIDCVGQDFTFASLSLLDSEAIDAAGINVIV
jgi:hypothetical protein